MKKFTMIAALLFLMAMPMMAERVTPETARKVATTFLNNNGAKTAQMTDLSKAAGFPNLYIFNGGEGFVVMAADDCVQPILGYSLTGEFVAEDMPENMIWWLQGYNDEIQFAVDSKMKASSETAKLWKDLAEGNSKAAKATVVVAPLIQTKWNQNKYYNRLCPTVSDGPDGHTYTGCVATAMAQVMKYWSYPSHGIGSHSYSWNGQTLSADFGATTYDWANMADYYEYYFANGTDQYAIGLPEPSAEEIAAVATLMYHCGVSVDMNYGGNSTGGSAAPNSYVATALKNYFNYSSAIEYKEKSHTNTNVSPWVTTTYYTDDEWISMLRAELDASRPMQYGGSDPNGLSGHAFVCDGYDNTNYFHFNWGWAGRYNGYFTISNLNTGANSGEAGAGNGTYTRDQDAIFGIRPASMIPAPTNLTYTVSGLQNLTLTWDAASGASSYNVYRDGNLISNVTENTYSETAPFGTYTYYVRSVDANGQLSLGSNTVSVTIAYLTPIVNDLTGSLSGNSVNLSWTAPEWCYPETPSATLTYGDGIMSSRSNAAFWAHRFLANNLAQYGGKAIYKISIYAYEEGSYTFYIYKGTTSTTYSGDNIFFPTTMMAEKMVEITSTGRWVDIDLDNLVSIDGQEDLWVIINYPNAGNGLFPATFSSYTSSENHGDYYGKWDYGYSGGRRGFVQKGNIAYLIRTYVTDGTYTYNLYQDGERIAQNLSQVSYSANLSNDAANVFTIKTNYYGGETDNSNKIGFSKGNASLGTLNLAGNDLMTITPDSKLTVTSLSSASSGNLILENGAQLLNESGGVKATVKKDITAYTADDDGWYFIASPMTENLSAANVSGLLANNFDLYLFDQSQTSEWRNYEANSFSNLNHKTGYLYANSVKTTLSFAGTLAASAEATDLAYDDDATFKGFNLIGNPYPCNTTITNDFYIIDGNTVTLAERGRTIAPCEGVFVKATGENETVTFNKVTSAKDSTPRNCIDLVVSQGKATTDRARVRFGEGIGMEKFSLDEKHSQITLWQNGQDYAVAYADGLNEMPVNFVATQDGTYTLSVENDGHDLDYLHLIDNMTGEDVDLLAMPSYTFEAKTNDYPSRFRLMFAPEEDGASTSSATFAYYANGEIIITGVLDACNASLQIVDMMGHVITTCVGRMQCIPTSGMTPGVYVLRLIDGETIRTQKIVLH